MKTHLPTPRILLMLLLTSGFVALLAVIADAAGAGETGAVDRQLLLLLRNPNDLADPLGPDWLESVSRDVTALGSFTVLTGVSLAVAGLLLLEDLRRMAVYLCLSIAGGMVVSHLLKLAVARPRPELVPHATDVHSLSFPSGHSMLSAVVFLTLAALASRALVHRRSKIYLMAVAVLAAMAVGVSRVHLGVHWPSDVAAGWAAGAAWALLCWECAERLERRGHLRSKPVED